MKKELKDLFDARLKQFADALQRHPKSLRKAGEVVRYGTMKSFRKFLRREGIIIMESDAYAFRDYLITQRLDLKDLEPEARKRLRTRTLEDQDAKDTTTDFAEGTLSGADLRCRDCKWFITAPDDGDGENHDKSCVALGTKGIDKACVGFLWDITRLKSA